MKKRLFSILLALCLCIGLMPVAALADNPVTIRSVEDLQIYFPGDSEAFVINKDAVIIDEVDTFVTMKHIEITGTAAVTIADGGLIQSGLVNQGSIVVEKGGTLATTQGGSIFNMGSIAIKEGGVLQSQMGGSFINEADSYLTLDGDFYCGGFKNEEGETVTWFTNNGIVTGSGSVLVPDGSGDMAGEFIPDTDEMIANVMSQLGADTEITVRTASDIPDHTWKCPYTDVTEDDWYFDSVRDLSTHGIMTGKTETYFGAAEDLRREEFATILYRVETLIALKPEVSYSAVFPDVPDGTWYTDPILWAYGAKVITGYADGTFGVSKNMTRQEMVVMLYRYAAYKEFELGAVADLSVFPDANKVSDWAEKAMQWAVAAGLIHGEGDGRLNPLGSLHRAECAKILNDFAAFYNLF